jgi:hypothetical protein
MIESSHVQRMPALDWPAWSLMRLEGGGKDAKDSLPNPVAILLNSEGELP